MLKLLVGPGLLAQGQNKLQILKSGAENTLLEEVNGRSSICGGKRIIYVWLEVLHQDRVKRYDDSQYREMTRGG